MSSPAILDATSDAQAFPAPLRLSVRGAGCDGRILSIRADECFVGSGEDCNLRVPGPAVACVLVRRAEGTFARSRSAEVLRNGRTFHEEALLPGDRIAIGSAEIVVEDRIVSGAATRKIQRTLPIAAPARRARWDGALLVGEVRRLQQELREAVSSSRAGAISDPKAGAISEDRSSRPREQMEREREALTSLAETERAENECLRQELSAAQEERISLEARIVALESSLAAAESRPAAVVDHEETVALREQADSLRAMLADAEEKLEELERVHDARARHAATLAEEERLAAVQRAIVETEDRFRAERSRVDNLLAERDAEAAARTIELEREVAELRDRLAVAEQAAAERRPDPSIDFARARFEEEQAEFRRLQRLWDEERSEYERLAAEQTALIAEKQRELREMRDGLEASSASAPSTFVETDRLAWEEEKAAFEEIARSRMEELADKTRHVEDRLRLAAERQREAIERERQELREERDALAREREMLASARAADGAFPSPVETEQEPTPAAMGGFRFFGNLEDDAPASGSEASFDLPVDAFDDTIEPSIEDREALDPEESERLRLRAESRLERFAHPERIDEPEHAGDVAESRGESAEGLIGDGVSAGIESGFLLRSFLGEDGTTPSMASFDESPKESADEPIVAERRYGDASDYEAAAVPASSVADILARLGHSIDSLDEEPTSPAPVFQPPRVEFTPAASFAEASDETPPGEDDSIEDYMQGLLRRVRGDAQVELTKPVENVSRTVVFQSAAPVVVEPPPEESIVPLTQSEFVPRSEAPEQGNTLSAMRALANETTRSAIFSSAVRRSYGTTATLAALAGGASLVGALVLWFGSEQGIIYVVAGLAIWGFAGWWGFRASKSLAELRRLSKPARTK